MLNGFCLILISPWIVFCRVWISAGESFRIVERMGRSRIFSTLPGRVMNYMREIDIVVNYYHSIFPPTLSYACVFKMS